MEALSDQVKYPCPHPLNDFKHSEACDEKGKETEPARFREARLPALNDVAEGETEQRVLTSVMVVVMMVMSRLSLRHIVSLYGAKRVVTGAIPPKLLPVQHATAQMAIIWDTVHPRRRCKRSRFPQSH
jgi:hypothetical protein